MRHTSRSLLAAMTVLSLAAAAHGTLLVADNGTSQILAFNDASGAFEGFSSAKVWR